MKLQDLLEAKQFIWNNAAVNALGFLLRDIEITLKVIKMNGKVITGDFYDAYPTIDGGVLYLSNTSHSDFVGLVDREISKIELVKPHSDISEEITEQILKRIKKFSSPNILKKVSQKLIPVAQELKILTPDLKKVLEYCIEHAGRQRSIFGA